MYINRALPIDTSTGQLLHTRLEDYCRRDSGKNVRAKNQGVFCDTVLPRNFRSCIHKVSQYDCLNMGWTRITTIGMLLWTGEIPGGLIPTLTYFFN